MSIQRNSKVQMISLDQITVVNSRERGGRKFQQIVANISKIGLKRPITITPKKTKEDGAYYLVCGEGRLEAYRILDQKEIPAIIVHVTKQKLFLMSLAENIARRQHSAVELVREIGVLRDRKYSFTEIAKKTDLDVTYIRGIVKLLKKGEERLLQAVEKGQIPISVAITIACSDDHEIQRALSEAYEANDLRGKKLIATRRLIEKRRTNGKKVRGGSRPQIVNAISSKNLLKTYQEETARQRVIIKKSKLCETRLLFIISAFQKIIDDNRFIDLLRTESLDTLPDYLSSKIFGKGGEL